MKYERFLKSPVFKRFVRKRLFDRASIVNRLLSAWFRTRGAVRPLPRSAEGLRNSELYKQWWYYGIELLPDVVTKSTFPQDFPLLPRMLLRNCDFSGGDCLDIGSVEGLIPVLMCRQGARRVVATNPHLYNYDKVQAVRKYYRAGFDFRQIGSLYDLSKKFGGSQGFDLINLSGVLYHVYSPMHVLAGLRPLLKKDGLMIVSTNVVNRLGFTMEFNERGKLQREGTTFWYPTIPLFDYLLRYFKLLPLDALYYPYGPGDQVRYTPDFESGYLCVVCRATDEPAFGSDDEWALDSIDDSYETILLWDQERLSRQAKSVSSYRVPIDPSLLSPENRSLDLYKMVAQTPPVVKAERSQDSHYLHLADRI